MESEQIMQIVVKMKNQRAYKRGVNVFLISTLTTEMSSDSG